MVTDANFSSSVWSEWNIPESRPRAAIGQVIIKNIPPRTDNARKNIPSAAHLSASMIVTQIGLAVTDVQIFLREVHIVSKNGMFRNVKSTQYEHFTIWPKG